MSKNITNINTSKISSAWVTIQEAVKIVNKTSDREIKDSDIYRHALYGEISLSIYFQSPVILKKIDTSGAKIKLKPIHNSLIYRLCQLESNCFLLGKNLIISTDDHHIHSEGRVIDTTLVGYEYVLVQRLLAHSLGLPLPITGAKITNYGISVSLSGEIFQVLERVKTRERINMQMKQLPKALSKEISSIISFENPTNYENFDSFPIYNLPKDAYFVIKHTEIEKLINIELKKNRTSCINADLNSPLTSFLVSL